MDNYVFAIRDFGYFIGESSKMILHSLLVFMTSTMIA